MARQLSEALSDSVCISPEKAILEHPLFLKPSNKRPARRKSIAYKILDESFYNSLEEPSSERFNSLDTMAQNIEEPSVYGVFRDGKHYLDTLKLLLNSTQETQHRHQFFLKQILPHVYNEHMLDIGIGDGKLTQLLWKNFNSITLVDPLKQALDSVNPSNLNKNQSLHKILGSITEVGLPENCFDLAVLSHILYYIDPSEWFSVTCKVFNALKPGGLLAIVLNGELDKELLVSKFGGEHINLNPLINQLQQTLDSATIEIYFSQELFQSKALSPMLHIAGLHLYDVKATATKDQLTRFLNLNKNQYTGLYQLSVYQKFILLRKPKIELGAAKNSIRKFSPHRDLKFHNKLKNLFHE